MLYYFVLGQAAELSIIEIYSVLKSRGLDFTIEKFSPEILVAEIKEEINTEKLLDSLGGTIKIGQILTETQSKHINPLFIVYQLQSTVQSPQSKDKDNSLPAPDSGLCLPAQTGTLDSKLHFGFSSYELAPGHFRLPRNFGLEVKKELKAKGIASRLVTSLDKNLSSVTVAKNRLLKHGAEICLITNKGNILVGKTLAVQKFGEYSKFDYGRPGRDPHSGMLPPKVAKMMINLNQSTVQSPKSKAVILDPFCGSGTILQEAARLGYQNLTGSDISFKAIEDTRTNFQFLNQAVPPSPPAGGFGEASRPSGRQADGQIPDTRYQIPILYILDAQKLSTEIQPSSIDAIITEPFLGPPLHGHEPVSQIKKIIAELSALYLNAFAEFKKVLKPGGVVAIIFPIISGEPSISDKQLLEIKKLGFSPALNLPAKFKILLTQRGSVIYSRAGQRLEREIFVFKKN